MKPSEPSMPPHDPPRPAYEESEGCGLTAEQAVHIRTYPEMNAKIVGMLRLMPEESSFVELYAAKLIEDLQTAIAAFCGSVHLSGRTIVQHDPDAYEQLAAHLPTE